MENLKNTISKAVKKANSTKKVLKRMQGITLVALVITVIVMLILAGVSISALMGNEGLFARADNAVKQYGDAAKTEAAVINELLQSLDDINKKHYIYDKEDLEEFIDNVSAGNSYKGEEVILMDNIDLKGNKKDEATWWKPIEAFDSSGIKTPFEGIFDGNNHSITGLYAEMYEGKETLSIFNHINNAEIKNLTVDGEFIVGENSDNTNLAVAGLANEATGNCKITNCKNSIDVEKFGTAREAAGFIGAIGNGISIIENCINEGTIKGGNNCGGLVGIVYSGVVINNSRNTGTITNLYGNYAGGLIGRDGNNGDDYDINITINNSYNTGEITGINRTGGLAGRLGAGYSLKLTINNCYNEGKIMRGGNGCNLGGLIGQIVNTSNPCNVTICNSWNIADILLSTYEGGITGGIVSDIDGGKNVNIINCYNWGNLSDVTASGLVGRIRDTNNSNPVLNIINSYNSGKIEGSTFSAGIIRIQHATAKVDLINTYYSDASALKGVEGIEPTHTPTVKEDSYMREEAFVNELNNNISDIETEIELKKWGSSKDGYPILIDN